MASSAAAPASFETSPSLRGALSLLRTWTVARWAVAAAATIVAALVIGVPTGVIRTGFYTRMTPVLWWNYPVWAASALLAGVTAATYLRSATPDGTRDRSGRTLGATLLSTFAVGCPICNKLVVSLVGVSGALSYWAPLQPILGVLSVGLLGAGLAFRLRGMVSCTRPGTT